MNLTRAMKFFVVNLIVCLLTYVVFSAPTRAEAPDEVAWWESDTLIAVGYGLPSDKFQSPGQMRLSARVAAKSDAYRQLAEQLGDIHVTASETLTTKTVNAVIVGATILDEEWDESGLCSIVMSVPVCGVSNSVAAAVFERVEREDFPSPTTELETVEGNYTGLIIDCGDLELNPVMSPSIRDSDSQSIYVNLEYDDVISRGVVGFAFGGVDDEPIEIDDALVMGAVFDLSRAGDNPLVIEIEELGDDGSCPVVSTSDANKILSENQATHFLDAGSVVFMSNRIRGVRL